MIRYSQRAKKNIQIRYNKRECVCCEIKMKITKRKKKAKLHYIRYLVQYLQYEIWNFEEDCRKWNPKMFR